MQQLEKEARAVPSDFYFSVRVNFDLVKNKGDGGVAVKIVGPKDNPMVTAAYDANKIPDGFEWDFTILVKKLSARYSDFKQNDMLKGHQPLSYGGDDDADSDECHPDEIGRTEALAKGIVAADWNQNECQRHERIELAKFSSLENPYPGCRRDTVYGDGADEGSENIRRQHGPIMRR